MATSEHTGISPRQNSDGHVTEDVANAVSILLGQISTLADRADTLCYHQQVGSGTEELHMNMLRDMACQMGWLAEVAQLRLGELPGDMTRSGNAEDWLVVPAARLLEVAVPVR